MNVMLAVQTPDGLAFGYVLDASPRHVVFTVNSNLSPGMSFAWRMELKGYSETIMGRLTVTRAHPPRTSSEWPRFEATIDDIPEEDGVLLAVWMEDQEKGGSSRRLERDPDRFIKDMFSEGMRGASSAQTRLVIDRMNERTAKREQLFKKQKRGVGGDFGLSRESTVAGSSSVSSTAVRSRISAALGDFSRRKLTEPQAQDAPTPPASPPLGQAPEPPPPAEPLPPVRSHPTADAQVGEAPSRRSRTTEEIIADALRAAGLRSNVPRLEPGLPRGPEPVELAEPSDPARVRSEPEIAPVPEPSVPEPAEDPQLSQALLYDPSQTPALLVIRYPQAGDYADDYRRHLRNSGLFLKRQQLGARGDTLLVRLVTPAGTMECQAQVVAVMAAGTGLMLSLSKDQRAALAAAAT